MTRKSKSFPWPTALLVGLLVLSRWPNLLPPNFSALYAFVFCAGAFFKRVPLWIPWTTLLLTDILLNTLYYHTLPLHIFMLGNYLAFGLIYLLGRNLFSRNKSFTKLLFGGLLGAVLFYLISNTASWCTDPNYSKTLLGWIQALTIGTSGWPQTWEFFRNTLISGGLFTSLFSLAFLTQEAREPVSEEEAPEGLEAEEETTHPQEEPETTSP